MGTVRYAVGGMVAVLLGMLSVGVFLVVVGSTFFSGHYALGTFLVAIMLAVVVFNVYHYLEQL